ncbi:FAD-dependent oxidoreductase [Aeromicrobium yanjiei]|uniref:ferredoxin--NADP(+) reductase n=1 Tax=Aeromicrobium yanjiei TaxID=2662028 RepID=A0A5Q2MMH6_9ACTN|nr:FAD-dependent oxidoreductase [Aeromicrobium yanjiei]QGG41605.1 NADP oxidoreductase [Aeromicrobium yanjiei]
MASPKQFTRVAIVGAGPAGFFTADHLTYGDGGQIVVDLIERLPTPLGLLRYGVAPDHPNIKAAGATFEEILDRPDVNLLCNVDVGNDVTVEEIRANYDAVVYATGASSDRRLGIPGEDLPGSISATSFVKWYNGHPEGDRFDALEAESVAIIGAGNVALDVARILLKSADDFAITDVPHRVLEVLRGNKVRDVHVFGRRGPQYAKFTTKELRELGELDGVDVVLDPRHLEGIDPDGHTPAVKRNLKVLAGWAERELTGAGRRLHLHFDTRPVEVMGQGAMSGLRVEESIGGETRQWDLDAQMMLRSVGYRALPFPGVPFDEETATIPSEASRVVRSGAPSMGEYVVGWVKRGPTGILGTNRADAEDAVESLKADIAGGMYDAGGLKPGVAQLLRDRGISCVDRSSWTAIAAHEALHGETHGRGNVKVDTWDELLDAAGVRSNSPVSQGP